MEAGSECPDDRAELRSTGTPMDDKIELRLKELAVARGLAVRGFS